jgi:pyruvyltransferase
VNFSDKIIGDGFKYLDYFTSVRIDGYNAGDLRDKKSISEILSLIPDHKITFDGDKLLNSCPLNELVKS